MNRSRTVVVATPLLEMRVVVTRSRSAPPCAPSSIRASDSSVLTAGAFSMASRKSRYVGRTDLKSGSTTTRLDRDSKRGLGNNAGRTNDHDAAVTASSDL